MNDSTIVITLPQLRGMIGTEVRHRGMTCRVIEVLEDGPALVLQNVNQRSLQADQFGEPHRHVPDTYTVPVLGADRRFLHPDFLLLDLLELPK